MRDPAATTPPSSDVNDPPPSLSGTSYEHMAHELAGGDDDDLTPVSQWKATDGAYARLLAGEPGGTDAWEYGDEEFSLVIAEFATPGDARDAYEAFVQHQQSWNVGIEGSMAVTRNADGSTTVHHVTDHSMVRGAGWGIAAGVAIGVLFPPSVLAGAVVAGGGGAFIGNRQERHRTSELAEELLASTTPGRTRVIVLVRDTRAEDHGGSW